MFISNYLKVILDKSASEISPLKSYFTLSDEIYYSPVYLKIYSNVFYITDKSEKYTLRGTSKRHGFQHLKRAYISVSVN